MEKQRLMWLASHEHCVAKGLVKPFLRLSRIKDQKGGRARIQEGIFTFQIESERGTCEGLVSGTKSMQGLMKQTRLTELPRTPIMTSPKRECMKFLVFQSFMNIGRNQNLKTNLMKDSPSESYKGSSNFNLDLKLREYVQMLRVMLSPLRCPKKT